MAIMLVSTNFVFLFFGSGDLQEWNEPNKLTDSSTSSDEKSKGKTDTDRLPQKTC